MRNRWIAEVGDDDHDGPFAFEHSGLEAHTSTLDDQASMPYTDIIQFHSQYCSWGVVATVRIPKYHQYTSGKSAQGAIGCAGSHLHVNAASHHII